MNSLLAPGFLLLALLIPLGLLARRRRGASTVLFAPGADDLPRTWRVRAAPLPGLLQVAGLLLVVWALARPAERVLLPQQSAGIDIMLCVDTSSSMKANDLDVARTRLEVAKGAAASFVAGRRHDRIGLVSFARFPDLACPPTRDHDALREFLRGLVMVESDGPEDATGIGAAVARAAQVLESGEAKAKVVILLTDGEENIATADKPNEIAPVHAAQLCRELGVKVYAVAAGLGRRDRSGNWVKLDTKQLEILAEATGGRFFRAADAPSMGQVYRDIDALEKTGIVEPRHEIREKFLPYLAAAVSLILTGMLLQSTVLGVAP